MWAFWWKMTVHVSFSKEKILSVINFWNKQKVIMFVIKKTHESSKPMPIEWSGITLWYPLNYITRF